MVDRLPAAARLAVHEDTAADERRVAIDEEPAAVAVRIAVDDPETVEFAADVHRHRATRSLGIDDHAVQQRLALEHVVLTAEEPTVELRAEPYRDRTLVDAGRDDHGVVAVRRVDRLLDGLERGRPVEAAARLRDVGVDEEHPVRRGGGREEREGEGEADQAFELPHFCLSWGCPKYNSSG